jgi:hypothetical protein
MAKTTISKQRLQPNRHDHSRVSATSAVKRITKGLTAQNTTTAATATTQTSATAAVETKR